MVRSGTLENTVTLCASCGLQLYTDEPLCPHHAGGWPDDWAVGNRIMCDLLHRGKMPDRLEPKDRDTDFWAHCPEVV